MAVAMVAGFQATAESSSQAKQGSAAQQLNSLALLACASIFDRLLRQQTAHRVREVLALSGPLAGQESAALQSAWSMFMQQASSTLGDLGSGILDGNRVAQRRARVVAIIGSHGTHHDITRDKAARQRRARPDLDS